MYTIFLFNPDFGVEYDKTFLSSYFITMVNSVDAKYLATTQNELVEMMLQ